jgi:hypothetical protein
VLGGAVLVILGIVAFIEAYSHAPEYICPGEYTTLGVCSHEYLASGHLSQTAYDLLRIGGSALVIVGGLVVVRGLIRLWAAQKSQSSS